MGVAERVRDLVEPLLASRGLEVYDVEHGGATVRVLLTRSGGIDMEALGEATRLVSRALDEADPIPSQYTLEVSSPGLERPLRTAAHFRGALGAEVKVRLTGSAASDGERRLDGVLTAADDDGFTVRTASGEERRAGYADVDRARTVFTWGPAPKPGRSS